MSSSACPYCGEDDTAGHVFECEKWEGKTLNARNVIKEMLENKKTCDAVCSVMVMLLVLMRKNKGRLRKLGDIRFNFNSLCDIHVK